ncbi:MAG: hypothetical protein LBH02_00055 [Methanocalculaceae archaeon]|nr:hypothetical protein [Methanocalculaceae archaeon]
MLFAHVRVERDNTDVAIVTYAGVLREFCDIRRRYQYNIRWYDKMTATDFE